jgi:hypothetical protein
MSESAKRATPGFEREVVEDGHHACSSLSGTFSWGKQVDWIRGSTEVVQHAQQG